MTFVYNLGFTPRFFSSPKNLKVFHFLKQKKNMGFVKKNPRSSALRTRMHRKEPRHHRACRDVSHHQSYHASHVGVTCGEFRDRCVTVVLTFGDFFPGNGCQLNITDHKIWWLETWWLEILWDWYTNFCAVCQVAMSRWWGFSSTASILFQNYPSRFKMLHVMRMRSSPTRFFCRNFQWVRCQKTDLEVLGVSFPILLLFTKEGGCFKCLRLFHHTFGTRPEQPLPTDDFPRFLS